MANNGTLYKIKYSIILLSLLAMAHKSSAQQTVYEKDPKHNTTATYEETIDWYKQLDKQYDQMSLLTCGMTDIGKPLHLVVLSKDKVFDPAAIHKQDKRVLLFNNGIHPGEPEGIDASMMLVRDMLKKNALPANVVIILIPVYNIDGQINRGVSRINQNGPVAYGFRGNSRNYDLNRDFIKTDSRNSQSFQEIFNTWKPEIFMDNHTSNGSDYQYVMTLIPTQKDKLNPVLSSYLTKTLVPDLYKEMKTSGFEMVPYVNSAGETPESGISGFLESARYSTGYAALHNSIAFMPETHMLKNYKQRVEATYMLMQHLINTVQRDAGLIGMNRKAADDHVAKQEEFALNWKLNRDSFTEIPFKGYEAKKKPSEVSGLERLYYDRSAPFEKTIKVWDNFEPSVKVKKPIAYVIPQAWQRVVELLKLNGVVLKQLSKDTELEVESYYIADYKTGTRPFEGHYLHTGVELRPDIRKLKYYQGDYIVFVNQPVNRYIVETLEPQGLDSFFAWNFFDSILGQKEHFSAYVFEDVAAELLKKDPDLRKRLEEAKQKDAQMAKSASAQLDWVYRNSVYYEPTHLRYPVARVLKEQNPVLK